MSMRGFLICVPVAIITIRIPSVPFNAVVLAVVIVIINAVGRVHADIIAVVLLI